MRRRARHLHGAPPLSQGAPTQRLLLVDALRGVAASAVMLYHLYNAIAPRRELAVPDVVHAAFQLGEGGVQIFFVLSGFVIASNLDGLAHLTPITIARFMLRRSVRLDPVYWVMIALNAAFLLALSSTAKGSELGVGVVVTNMLYLNGLFGLLFIVPVGWTLAFEVQLYLMLATALGAVRALAARIGDLAARVLVCAPLLVGSAVLALRHPAVMETPWALAAWHMFFLGAVAWWVAARVRGALVWALAALVTTSVVFASTREPVTLLAPITALALIGAARANRLTFALGGAPLLWLGKISYSLYLVHPFIGNKLLRFAAQRIPSELGALEAQLLRWGLFLLASAVSLAAAWLLWRVVERPAQGWARRITVA